MAARSRNRPSRAPLPSLRPKPAKDPTDFISRAALSLSRESLLSKTVTFLLRLKGAAYDDHTGPLRQSPLGMFFYNQRTLFFLASGAFLLALSPLALRNSQDTKTLLLLFSTWAFAGAVTLALHRRFTRQLSQWHDPESTSSFPRLFYPYFILDSASILGLIALSHVFGLEVHFYSLLLFANVIVYSASVASWKGAGATLPVPIALWIACIVLFVRSDLRTTHQGTPFHELIDLGPQFGTTFVSIMAVLMISWLRQAEHRVTERQLAFLGKAEDLLSASPAAETDAQESSTPAPTERDFQARIRSLIKAICALEPPFWYGAGCFWYLESHQDRHSVLIPGPSYRMATDGLTEITLSKPLGALPAILCGPTVNDRFPEQLVVSAGETKLVAFIPIVKGKRECGVLTLYGEGSPLGTRTTELVFLKTLGRIVADIMEQWDTRGRLGPQDEVDELFKCESLDEIFAHAVSIIRQHFYASCAAIIFRRDPTDETLRVAAALGFKTGVKGLAFPAASQPIGECASSGKTVRCDDYEKHRAAFQDPQFHLLEERNKRPFLSWMLTPIGQKGRNFGVVLVANRRSKGSWFTEDDRLLAERLAIRLQALIEKFLHIANTESAHRRAEKKAAEYEEARKVAEETAQQRQDDLMVMTHQLQAPLGAVKFGLGVLMMDKQARSFREDLAHIDAIVEDSLSLCYGTVTTFAQAAGKRASFGADKIDAPTEFNRLYERLRRTNSRGDLQLEFKADKPFPKLRMDRNVFDNVLYNLVHNAMKYAAKGSYVTLECSFERSTGSTALKVKSWGEPIRPEERDRIFERFQRGTVIAKTGRYHAGVGLGLWVARQLMEAVGGKLTLEVASKSESTADWIRNRDDAERGALSVFVVHIPTKSVELEASAAV